MKRRPPITNQHAYTACLSGQLPAEALPTTDREQLIRVLHRRGWTDVEIAVHTSMTTYTTARIRSRIRLSPNHEKRGAA